MQVADPRAVEQFQVDQALITLQVQVGPDHGHECPDDEDQRILDEKMDHATHDESFLASGQQPPPN